MKKNTVILILLISLQTLQLSAGEIVLENPIFKVVFNENSGALEQLINKKTGWQIQRRPELARSFLMQVPLPDQRFNPVQGENQKLTNTHIENNQIVFTWKNLDSKKGGVLNIEFRGIVRLTGTGLIFSAEIENKSPYIIESVSWPYLGDLTIPAGAAQLYQLGMRYGGLKKLMLYPKFDNQPGYFAVDYPTQMMSTPYTLFSLIDEGTQGLYVGYQDTTAEHLVKFTARLLPGYISYELWDTGVNPGTDQIAGQPVRLEFSTVHFPFINPGEQAKLHPVVLHPYQGSWHKGADYYKAWRATWFKAPPKPDWFKNVHAWQQIHLNNPEDDIRYHYKDLIQIGEDCAKHDVKAIQVTGWTIGGQDKGNPSHDTDPRLGSKQDFQEAIDNVQQMGVKMILFTKYTWADRTKDWYREELINYTVKDPYGEPWYHSGYAYQTPVQLAEINTHRFSPMCHLSDRWRKIANKEFVKPLELNADGMLYDENQHHGGAHYCFDASHGHHIPAHIFAGDAQLAEGFHQISQKMNPEYLYAGEGNYDLEFRHYHLSYFRVDLTHVPIHRYVAPEEEMMIAVAGYNDRNMINLALMNRYIISYEPRNFKGRLDEFPMTIEYGKKVDALRKRFSEFLWTGVFKHTIGAKVTADGKLYNKYSVFENHNSGKRAVVVVNFDYQKTIHVEIKLEGEELSLLSASPADSDPKAFNGFTKIPPNSALVIMEK